MKEYYDILNVLPEAGFEEIKERYRLLVKQWHPDRFSNPVEKKAAEQKVIEINEAYTVLSNHEKREEYDNQRFFNEMYGSKDVYERQRQVRAEEQKRRAMQR
jgi:molecular chaperone DnaJ